MKKTLFAFMIIITGIFALGAVNASAATEGIYTYSVSNGKATITDCDTSASGDIEIPSTLGSCPVTSIGERAFSNCSSLTSITIPDGVTSINNYAFSDCSSLTSITIPDSVTSIGNSAFSNCSSLTSITIPDSVTSIGNYAFSNCSSLTSITIPDGVTSIGDYAFFECSSLKSIYISDLASYLSISFKNYNSNPLCNGGKLYIDGVLATNIVIPDGVASIGNYTFYNCSSLISITIPDSVTSIGDSAFYNCNSITSITIPDSVTSIGDSAFSNCSSITSITIPYSVTSIGNYAFQYCSSLISITIPDSVLSIGDGAFSNCSRLTSITIPDSVTSIGNGAFYNCSSLISIAIPDGVTSIGISAFSRCNRLTSITIPDGVTSIGNGAFSNCSSLTSITIPDGVTSIGEEAFWRCSSLTSATIGKGTALIPEKAFYNCSDLKYVALPKEVLYIRNDAFNGCSKIETVFYEGSEADWNKILFYSRNENLTNAKVVYNAEKKTYRFETNCNNALADITDYAIFTMPIVQNNEMTLSGWYDNSALSGEPVTFPYYGDATTLYASWTDRTGKTFDDAFIAKANREYTVTTTENGQLVYFEFVPTLSKKYYFYTTGSKDTYGYLYDSNKSQLTSNDDSGDGNNFRISCNLTAGQTYYIAAKIYSGTGTFTFVAEEPVDYRINGITIKDSSENILDEIPTGQFFATVSFTNVSSSEGTTVILAQYTDKGEFCGMQYIQIEDLPIGSPIKLSFRVDNPNGDTAKLKAFCWKSIASLKSMGNSACFPAE